MQASPQAEQAIRQFMSEGLAAGDIVETLQIAEQDRPDISVLSDEFLDSITAKTEHPNVQIRLLERASRYTASRLSVELAPALPMAKPR